MQSVVIFFRKDGLVVMTLMLHAQEHHDIHLINHLINGDKFTIVRKLLAPPFFRTCKVELCSQALENLHI